MKKQILDRQQFLALAKVTPVINILVDRGTGFFLPLDKERLLNELENSNSIKRVTIINEDGNLLFVVQMETL